MSGSILLVGATGNVGMPLATMLAKEGYRVKATVRASTNVELLQELGIETIQADLHDFFGMMNAMDGVRKVFFTVPLVPNVVRLSKNIVQAASEAGVEHLVKVSGGGANLERTKLQRWHREIEREMEQAGPKYTFLRPNSFMQNFVNFNAGTIRDHASFYLPIGDGKISFIDARDIALTAYHILTEEGHEGMAYELSGPEALSGKDVASILTRTIRKEIKYIDVPEQEARRAMLEANMPDSIADAMMEMYHNNKLGYTAHVNNTVYNITGEQPHTFQSFVEDYKSSFLS